MTKCETKKSAKISRRSRSAPHASAAARAASQPPARWRRQNGWSVIASDSLRDATPASRRNQQLVGCTSAAFVGGVIVAAAAVINSIVVLFYYFFIIVIRTGTHAAGQRAPAACIGPRVLLWPTYYPHLLAAICDSVVCWNLGPRLSQAVEAASAINPPIIRDERQQLRCRRPGSGLARAVLARAPPRPRKQLQFRTARLAQLRNRCSARLALYQAFSLCASTKLLLPQRRRPSPAGVAVEGGDHAAKDTGCSDRSAQPPSPRRIVILALRKRDGCGRRARGQHGMSRGVTFFGKHHSHNFAEDDIYNLITA